MAPIEEAWVEQLRYTAAEDGRKEELHGNSSVWKVCVSAGPCHMTPVFLSLQSFGCVCEALLQVCL